MLHDRPSPAMLSGSARAFGRLIQNADPSVSDDAGILAALCFHAAAEGHSCLDMAQLPDIFPRHARLAEQSLSSLFSSHPLVAVVNEADADVRPALLVVFQQRLYLKKYWDLECRLIRCLQRRSNSGTVPESDAAGLGLATACMHKPMVFLTGGPGTGKTTAIAEALPVWIQAFLQNHQRAPRVSMCAPTGKAALRMTAALSRHLATRAGQWPEPVVAALPAVAQTIHRFLRKNSVTGHSPFSADNPLAVDLLVLDEASMIDLPMLVQTLEALPEQAVVLLSGDPKQLPSVELGNVLGTLLSEEPENPLFQSLRLAHRQLTHNYRQAESPGLALLSSDMSGRQYPDILQKLQTNAYVGVTFQSAQDDGLAAVVQDNVVHYRNIALQASVEDALQLLEQRTVLCAVRQGHFGCVALNAGIQRRLSSARYQQGQALLITENAPALGLANGDTGLVWPSMGALTLHLNRPEGIQRVPLHALPKHELGYALTVHKAQGSEYSHVDLILPAADSPLLNRALLYTAITRARNTLTLIGTPEALSRGLETNPIRMNGLAASAAFNEK